MLVRRLKKQRTRVFGSLFLLIQEQLKSAQYAVDCMALSSDYREAVSYNLRKNKFTSNKHVQQALCVRRAASRNARYCT